MVCWAGARSSRQRLLVLRMEAWRTWRSNSRDSGSSTKSSTLRKCSTGCSQKSSYLTSKNWLGSSRAFAAIALAGQSVVEDNRINGLLPTTGLYAASGIRLNDASHSVVQGNVLGNLATDAGPVMVAIYSNGSAGVVVRANTVSTPTVVGTYGVACNTFACRCRDNQVLGTSVNLLNCWDDGGNVHSSTH